MSGPNGAFARPILVDLDLVTPYFRSRETTGALRERGVEVIAPLDLTECVDVPAVTPQILGAIEQTSRPVVVDVGGDEQGGRALGRYSNVLRSCGYEMAFVVNPYRPYTATSQAIQASIVEIERSSRLEVSALVSNPNLMGETDLDVIRAGHELVLDAAHRLGLPVAFLVAMARFQTSLQDEYAQPVLPLRRFFLLPWEEEEDSASFSRGRGKK